MKWAFELEEFEVLYQLRTAIKGQALAYFVAEFTYPEELDEGIALPDLHLVPRSPHRLGSYT